MAFARALVPVGACLVLAAVAPSASGGGEPACAVGKTRSCVGKLPDGINAEGSHLFAGAQSCAADASGQGRFGACELVRCEGDVVVACKTSHSQPGVAKCTPLVRESDDEAQGSAFGECGVIAQCRPPETRACTGPTPRADGTPIKMPCALDQGRWTFAASACATPIVLVFDDRPVTFTRPGGRFAIGGDDSTEWVDARSPWLAVDLDGDGEVGGERELFGTATAGGSFTSGFEALGAFDDDHDGRITARDAVWPKLRVWRDANQDRRSSPDEVTTLDDERVTSIDLAFASRGARTTSYEGEVGSFAFEGAGPATGGTRRGRVVDVHLAPQSVGRD